MQAQIPGRGGCGGRVNRRDEHWIGVDIAPNGHKAGIRRPIAAATCALGQAISQDNGGVVDGGGNGAGTAAVLVIPQDAVVYYWAICYSHSKIR